MRLGDDKLVISEFDLHILYFTIVIMNPSGDIVKGILQGSSNVFLVESSSDGSGLPWQ